MCQTSVTVQAISNVPLLSEPRHEILTFLFLLYIKWPGKKCILIAFQDAR